MTSPIRTAAERAATALEPAVWELVRDLHMMAEDNRKIDWLREEQICLQSADRLASLAAERDTLERSSLESSMLAHGWMVAHNKLLGWVQKHQDVLNRLIDERPDIPLPSPVDLPNALRDRDALAARVSELEGEPKLIVGNGWNWDNDPTKPDLWDERGFSPDGQYLRPGY